MFGRSERGVESGQTVPFQALPDAQELGIPFKPIEETNDHSLTGENKARASSLEDEENAGTFEQVTEKRERSDLSCLSELDLEREINSKIQESTRVRELEFKLEALKTHKLSHKDLQAERNRITAQLSRDRKKIELDFLKLRCIELGQ